MLFEQSISFRKNTRTLLLVNFILISFLYMTLGKQLANENDNTKPRFTKPIENVTTVLGRNAVLECSVDNLGPYNKIAWIKMDSSNSEPTVLTIGTQTLFGENKYRVTHNGHRQWFLNIKHVRISDRGNYMCQVNAKTMISQTGHLEIQVPPILIEEKTSSDITVDEHQKAILKCTVKGYPKPKILWRREDEQPINLGLYGGQKHSAQTFEGSQLNLTQVSREDMGAYLCIASNGVPPSLSRRILLHVNFRPKIRVQNQLVIKSMGSDAELVCLCEAYPHPMVTWITPAMVPIVFGSSASSSSSSVNPPMMHQNGIQEKYEIKEDYHGYKTTMKLKIKNLQPEDFGTFKCLAKNTLGEKEGLIRLYDEAESRNKQSPQTVQTTYPTDHHQQKIEKIKNLKTLKSRRKSSGKKKQLSTSKNSTTFQELPENLENDPETNNNNEEEDEFLDSTSESLDDQISEMFDGTRSSSSSSSTLFDSMNQKRPINIDRLGWIFSSLIVIWSICRWCLTATR